MKEKLNKSKRNIEKVTAHTILKKRKKTRMTTSISSEARRNQTPNLISRPRKSRFPPKPDGQTDRHTDGLTDERKLVFIE